MNVTTIKTVIGVLLLSLISCKTGEIIKNRPAPQVITKSYQPTDVINISKSDCAKAKSFKDEFQKIKRLAIQYTDSVDSQYPLSEMKASAWHKNLEKSLIRLGIIISDEPLTNKLFSENEDETEAVSYDARFIVEKASLKKIESKYSFEIDTTQDAKTTYPFAYYIAEISGKLVLNNNDILWSGSITASSLNLIKIKYSIDPTITCTGTRDFRYSGKLKKWTEDSWVLEVIDNFQSFYKDPVQEKFHQDELVSHVVGSFIGTLSAD